MKNLILFATVIILLSGCSKDADPETKIDSPSLNLKYDQSHQFTVNKGNDILSDPIVWISTDPSVGSVAADGKFTARKIGSTVVKATAGNQEYSSFITVSPYSTIFRETEFQFGLDKATVKAKTIRSLVQETDNSLVYSSGDEHVGNIIYVFQNDLLAGVAVDFKDDESTRKEAEIFYKERYPVTATLNGTEDIIYINDLQNMGVRLTKNESLGFYVSYSKVVFTNGRLSPDFKSLRSIFDNLK